MNTKQQFNVYLSSEVVTQMKHRSIDEQLSMSDLVEKIFTTYLTPIKSNTSSSIFPTEKKKENNSSHITVQPMVHVENMAKAIDFYQKLGGMMMYGSRDSDWASIRFGNTEINLLAHPANPEQNEGDIELNFESAIPLDQLENELRKKDIVIARPTGDEGFGFQLQIEDPEGKLIKINQINPELIR